MATAYTPSSYRIPQQYSKMLQQDQNARSGMVKTYSQIFGGKTVIDSDTTPFLSALKLTGLVRSEAGRLRVRNKIYARVFDQTWTQQIRQNKRG